MKKKKILILTLLVLMILLLPGVVYYKLQLYKITYLYTYFKLIDEDYITQNQKKIDIIKYDLSFDLYPEKKLLTGHAILYGKIMDTTLHHLDFNFYDNFDIEKIILNDRITDYENEDKRLTIPLYNSGIEDFKLEIIYRGTPKKAGLEGFVFGKRNGTSLVYNLSEPNFASSWFPCNDIPFDKTILDIKITNDSSMVSVSNGILVDVNTVGSRRTYHWKTEYPISTYLVAIYSSDYESFSDEYISLDGKDTMKIEYYVLPDKLEKAKVDFASQSKMLEVLSGLFGEYPFINEKYGVAEFLWSVGAMEHQTITGVSSNMITGKNYFEDTYVHEAAHQWWGNAVGPKSWKDIWLNEGFATYSEALYYEVVSGKKALQSTMLSKYSSNFSGVLAEPGSYLFTRTMYDKGAWVLHMLRWEVGDSSFFRILRTYFESFKYSNASTSGFKNVCEMVSGKNLNRFFEQWVYGKGQIELEYNYSTIDSGKNKLVRINSEQVQDSQVEFHFPLEIKMTFSDESEKRYLYEINSRKNNIEILTDELPLSLELDPDHWLLASINHKDE